MLLAWTLAFYYITSTVFQNIVAHIKYWPNLLMVSPLLVPAELRKQVPRLTEGIEVLVTVQSGPPPRPTPAYLALTDAQRQHRRLTWEQRLQRNALGSQCTVRIQLCGATSLVAKLLPSLSDREFGQRG
jgi:hypothetical protein